MKSRMPPLLPFSSGSLDLSATQVTFNRAVGGTGVTGGTSLGGGISTAIGPFTAENSVITGNAAFSGLGTTTNGLGFGGGLVIISGPLSPGECRKSCQSFCALLPPLKNRRPPTDEDVQWGVPSRSDWGTSARFEGRAGCGGRLDAWQERNDAMRKRAYRPEVSGYLEDRTMLSHVAVVPGHPVVLLNRNLSRVFQQMKTEFFIFARGHAVAIDALRDDLRDVAVIIPFGQGDGLGVTINHILDRMEQNLSARIPRAVASARDAVIAATRAEVLARVRAGDVVVH